MNLLALPLVALLQTEEPPPPARDPLQHVAELEVGLEGAEVRHVAESAGTLHAWVRAEGFEPELRVEVVGRALPEITGWEGGGSAWLALDVTPGETVVASVAPRNGVGGNAQLHLATASETPETTDAAQAAALELDVIRTLRSEGRLADARSRVAVLVEALLTTRDADASGAIADALRAAGLLAHQLSAVEPCASAFEAALEHRARLLPPEHPDLLAARMDLGWGRRGVGDLTGAQELYEAVHDARERLLPPEHPDLLNAKGVLAWTRRMLGDPYGALELEEVVLATRERLLPPDHPKVLAARHNIGWTSFALGDFPRALEHHEIVYAARALKLPAEHPALLASMVALASALYALGDLEEAKKLQEAVLAVRERRLPSGSSSLLYVKQNLSLTLWELGDLAGALELAEEVHAEHEAQASATHREVLVAELSLMLMLSEQGEHERAVALIHSLLDKQLAVASRLRTEPPRVARSAAAAELRRLAQVLSVSAPEAHVHDEELDELQPRLFAVLETLRAVASHSTQVAAVAAERPRLAALRDRVARARSRLSAEVVGAADEGDDGRERRRAIVELAFERDRLERELRAALDPLGIAGGEVSAEVAAHAIASDSALVSFFRYRRRPDEVPGDAAQPAVDCLLAFVVTPDARVRRVELGPAAPLERLARRWRADLGQPAEARGVGIAATSQKGPPAGAELRAALLTPCLEQLERPPATLHLILDDFLHSIPMGALPDENGGLLQDELDLRLATSVARIAPPPRHRRAGTLLLALGGVDFDAEGAVSSSLLASAIPPVRGPESRRGTLGHLRPLPETAVEVEELGALHEELVEGERIVLTQEGATKQALFEHAAEARFLHIATHGWFAADEVTPTTDDRPRRAGLMLTFAQSEGTVQLFAPETLCGLALCGANRGVDARGRMTGIVTAEEIATLDLSSCELAVLSACETNVGLPRAGLGIQSLQTALHAAGVRTTITSLWKVDDEATRELFGHFYAELWKGRVGKAEALRRAQSRLRDAGRPPLDWAAWVLSGDPE